MDKNQFLIWKDTAKEAHKSHLHLVNDLQGEQITGHIFVKCYHFINEIVSTPFKEAELRTLKSLRELSFQN